MSGTKEPRTPAEQHQQPPETPPDDQKPPETPPATEPEKQDPIVLAFKPRTPGEFMHGVPARDLTQADVDALDPWALANATAEGPDGTALYVSTKKGDD